MGGPLRPPPPQQRVGSGLGPAGRGLTSWRVKCAKRALIFKPLALVRIKRAWSHRSNLNVAGETVTVITRRYIAVLKRFLRALNSKCAGTLNQQSFPKDGPATHTRTSRDNLAWLQDRFKGRLFLPLRLQWAGHHVRRISPLRIFLVGYLKSIMHQGAPETLGTLKQAILAVIYAIYPA